MPDLLAHAFIAYTLCTMLSWRYEWLSPAYITVGMAGAFIPDMTKLYLVIPDAAVEQFLGGPFSWGAVHTTGGALVAVAIGATVVEHRERRRVTALLALGAASHLAADAMLLKPTGHSSAALWPLTRWHPPTPGLYLSTEPWPTLVTGALAVGAWIVTRRRGLRRHGRESDASR